MTQPGNNSRHMIVKLRTIDGKCERIKDEKGNDRTPLSPTEIEDLLASSDTKRVGVILYTHSSPG